MGVNVDKRLDSEVRQDPTLQPYKRIMPSPQSRSALRERGMSWVLSSNVSAVGVEKVDLFVRFHNGSIYKYHGAGSLYQDMLDAPSKGRFVWDRLRRTNIRYTKAGSMPLEEDVEVDDEEVMRIGISTKQLREIKDTVAIQEKVLREKVVKSFDEQADKQRQEYEERTVRTVEEKAPRSIGGEVEESEERKPQFDKTPEPYKTKTAGKTYDIWTENIKNKEIDKDTADVLSNVEKVYTKGDSFKNTKNAKVSSNWFGSDLKNPKLTKNSGMDDITTLTHETGHVVDIKVMRKAGYSYQGHRKYDVRPMHASSFHKTKIPENEMNADMLRMKESSQKLENALHEEMKKDIEKDNPEIINKLGQLRKDRNNMYKDIAEKDLIKTNEEYKAGKIGYDDYKKKFNKVKRDGIKKVKKQFDDKHHGDMALSDMYDAMSDGKLHSGGKILSGHGRKYYRKQGKKQAELYANYVTAKTHDPKKLDIFKKDYPKVYNQLEDLNKNISGIMVK